MKNPWAFRLKIYPGFKICLHEEAFVRRSNSQFLSTTTISKTSENNRKHKVVK